MAVSVDSQCTVILRELMRIAPNGLSTMDIIKRFGITRPAARVFDLRERGVPIDMTRVSIKDDAGREVNHYAVYSYGG